MTEAENKIRDIVVIPRLDSDQVASDAAHAFEACSEFFTCKIEECKQKVKETSPVLFMANSIQSRIVGTELCTKLTKVYEALNVCKVEDFEKKLKNLEHDSSFETDRESLEKMKNAMSAWENFLAEIDAEIEKVAGPATALGPEDNIPLSKNKTVQSGTLLAYVKNSSYGMLFIQVVTSFSSSEASELVLKSYEKLSEFQRLDCDILLLTKGTGGDGSGFLKLVGVPFRMLLNEQESLYKILQHRQSAVSIAGIKALNLFTEIICNDEALNVSRSETDPHSLPGVGALGGCLLVDRAGNLLYNYTCTDNTNWPDVEVLLEQVKLNKKAIDEKEASKPASTGKGDTVVTTSSKLALTENDMNVAVSKKKCCIIL